MMICYRSSKFSQINRFIKFCVHNKWEFGSFRIQVVWNCLNRSNCGFLTPFPIIFNNLQGKFYLEALDKRGDSDVQSIPRNWPFLKGLDRNTVARRNIANNALLFIGMFGSPYVCAVLSFWGFKIMDFRMFRKLAFQESRTACCEFW